MFSSFTVGINCSSDLNFFTNSRLSTSNFKCFSQSLEHFFSHRCQNKFGNKICTNSLRKTDHIWRKNSILTIPIGIFSSHLTSLVIRGQNWPQQKHSAIIFWIYIVQTFTLSAHSLFSSSTLDQKNCLKWGWQIARIYYSIKSVHFKKSVTQISFLSKSKQSCIENDNAFERNEIRVTGFLKWTDFSLYKRSTSFKKCD